MPDYQKMYRIMFNAATDAVQSVKDTYEKLETSEYVSTNIYLMMEEILLGLKTAQIECEKMYMDEDEQAEKP